MNNPELLKLLAEAREILAEAQAKSSTDPMPMPWPIIDKIDRALPDITALLNKSEKMENLLRKLLQASDENHPDFLDSGSDTIQLLWEDAPDLIGYVPADEDESVLGIGDSVVVTPKNGNIFNEFVGTIISMDKELVLVEDQDGNGFHCDYDQIELADS
jgi:hypothetical protein